jgi:hypothetical protein
LDTESVSNDRVTLWEPSKATITKPISISPRGGIAAPEFEESKKYPTVGYLTQPINITITIITPSTTTNSEIFSLSLKN